MCTMRIDSWTTPTPSEVSTLIVICEVGSALGGCSVDLNIWSTDVNDDPPGSLYDGMDDRLGERFNRGEAGSSSSF